MQISHMRHTNDCRYWIENRPDALFDVKIHRIMRRAPSGGNVITGLMCYIPGKSAFVLFDHANSSVQYKVYMNFLICLHSTAFATHMY